MVNLAMAKPMEAMAPEYKERDFRSVIKNEKRLDVYSDGVNFCMSFLLVSMYNANETMGDKELKKYYKAVVHDMVHRMNEFYITAQANKADLNNHVDLLISHDAQIRKKLGMEPR